MQKVTGIPTTVRIQNSINGNPRCIAVIDGVEFITKPDHSSITRLENAAHMEKPITVTLERYYGRLAMQECTYSVQNWRQECIYIDTLTSDAMSIVGKAKKKALEEAIDYATARRDEAASISLFDVEQYIDHCIDDLTYELELEQ